MMRLFLISLVLLTGFTVSHHGLAKQTTPSTQDAESLPDLNDDQRQAMAAINQRTVQAAVSFLASDELGGRGTPSPGYTIACAYVASRFEAAGLEGGAPNGDFFQTRELETTQMPSGGIRLNTGTRALPHLGLIAATDDSVSCRGQVSRLNDWDAWNDLTDEDKQELAEIVFVPHSSDKSTALQIRQWSRRAGQLHSHGAQVLLLGVDPESDLVDQAAQMAATPRWNRRGGSAILPILLVDQSSEFGELADITIPAVIHGKQLISNVIAKLPGRDPRLSDEAVVFSAHLDHLGVRDNGTEDSIYNGADDNASGVTGVLSLADAFGALKTRPARTTLFVAFWGEEMGLLGSRYLVENPVWPLQKITAMINLEMIGRPEPGAHEKAWMTGWEKSDLGILMAPGADRVGIQIFEHPSFSSQLYRASDNWPFVQAGVVAHSFSAGSLHGDYHQPDDRWEKLETRHMTRVIQGLFAGALPIAEGRLTPRASDP